MPKKKTKVDLFDNVSDEDLTKEQLKNRNALRKILQQRIVNKNDALMPLSERRKQAQNETTSINALLKIREQAERERAAAKALMQLPADQEDKNLPETSKKFGT